MARGGRERRHGDRRRVLDGVLAGFPRRAVFAGGFLLFCGLLVMLVLRLLAPFTAALLWAAVLTIVLFPFYRWLVRITGGQRTLAAGISTGLLAAAVLGPTGFFVSVLASESRDAYDGFRAALAHDEPGIILDRLLHWVAGLLPGAFDESTIAFAEAELKRMSTGMLSSISAALSHGLNSAVANASRLVIGGFVALLSVFYFLRDGEQWLERARETVPLSPRVWDLVVERFSVTLRAVVHGMLLCAAILALLLAAGYKYFGVPLPAFFGMISFFVAPIPFLGVVLVWFPACAWLYVVQQNTSAALGLFAYGAVMIFVVDNLLRPAIIGSIARLPVFFMLIAILGGLMAYGPLGLFLGPVLLAVAMSVGGVFRAIASSRTR